MARWVKLPDILIQRAHSWSAEAIECQEAREKLEHVTQVALDGVSAWDQRAMTAISPAADRMAHDGDDAPLGVVSSRGQP